MSFLLLSNDPWLWRWDFCYFQGRLRACLHANATGGAFIRYHQAGGAFKGMFFAESDARITANAHLFVEHDHAQLAAAQRVRRADNYAVAALVADNRTALAIFRHSDVQRGAGGVVALKHPGCTRRLALVAAIAAIVAFAWINFEGFHSVAF
jgi:hypothetical protein